MFKKKTFVSILITALVYVGLKIYVANTITPIDDDLPEIVKSILIQGLSTNDVDIDNQDNAA